jgi:hypothetical protein
MKKIKDAVTGEKRYPTPAELRYGFEVARLALAIPTVEGQSAYLAEREESYLRICNAYLAVGQSVPERTRLSGES